jgi:hypothetical protein
MGELVPLYAAAGERGVSPVELDLLEIWEVAAFFGIGLRTADEGGFAPGAPRIVPYSQGGQDPNLAARIARAQGQDVPDVIVSSYHPRMGVLN